MAAAAAFFWLLQAAPLQNAIANGETRTLNLYHEHTKESLRITYMRNGSYDRNALEKLNWFLRDWRRDEPTNMDPRLFDTVWAVQSEMDTGEPIHVVSAYRSPETNAMLRSRSRGVAKHSQHTQGKAMDFYIPGASMGKVREIGLRMQRGGVGYYPSAHNPFVHLDAGSVRHWPRMPRHQLARLFPDGKTVHLPADGRPMERYAEALAEVERNGGTAPASYAAYAAGGGTKSRSLWSRIFGPDDEDEGELPSTRPIFAREKPIQTTSRAAVAQRQPAAQDDDSEEAPANNSTIRRPLLARNDVQEAPPTIIARPQQELRNAAPVPAPLERIEMANSALVQNRVSSVPMPTSAPLPQVRSQNIELAAAPSTQNGPQLIWQTGAASRMGLSGPIASVPIPTPSPERVIVASIDPVVPASGRIRADVPVPQASPWQATAQIARANTAGTLQHPVTEPVRPSLPVKFANVPIPTPAPAKSISRNLAEAQPLSTASVQKEVKVDFKQGRGDRFDKTTTAALNNTKDEAQPQAQSVDAPKRDISDILHAHASTTPLSFGTTGNHGLGNSFSVKAN